MKVQTFICYKGKSLSLSLSLSRARARARAHAHTHTLFFLGHTTPLQEDSISARAYNVNINQSPTIKLNKKAVKNLAL